MKKTLKWVVIGFGLLLLLIVGTLLVVPFFIDLNDHKPRIEHLVSEAVGREFKINGDLRLSLFPWVGVGFSGLELGQPEGFSEKTMVSIESFDVEVQLLPLLEKKVQISRFVLKHPRIVLEKTADGRVSWDGLGKKETAASDSKPASPPASQGGPGMGLPIQELKIGEIVIENGELIYLDAAKSEKQTVTNLQFSARDIDLEKPLVFMLSARLAQKPIKLEGRLGALDTMLSSGVADFSVSFEALDQLNLRLEGTVNYQAAPQTFDIALDLAAFSPRQVLETLGLENQLDLGDPGALSKAALKLRLTGNPQAVALKDGNLQLDDTICKFNVQLKDFEKPDIRLDLDVDRINLDRYLPPPPDQGQSQAPATPMAAEGATAQKPQSIDYGPLRKLVLDAKLVVGRLEARKLVVGNIEFGVSANQGILKVNPLKCDLYDGRLDAQAKVYVTQEKPWAKVEANLADVLIRPFLLDLLGKEKLEGTLNAALDLQFKGDTPAGVKQTLNGKGQVKLTNGAIVGIDLTSMVQNLKNAFALSQSTASEARTDFSEFFIPFDAADGVITIDGTRLMSPLLRLGGAGTVNLNDERLDLRLEPNFVATIKGQGGQMDRSGVKVPVLVTGTFQHPKFTPDLKDLVEKGVKKILEDPQSVQKTLEKGLELKDKPLEDTAKDLLKQFNLGQ